MQSVFLEWLHTRKITDSVIEEFKLVTNNHQYLGEALVIPIYAPDGHFVFNKYRRSPLIDTGPKYIYDKGGSLTLFGADKIKNEKRVLITEGELDTLVAWSANIPAVSSTGGAMSFDRKWFDLLMDKEVIFCFDNDATGGDGMARALDIVPHAKVLFLPDRAGVKDISDYVTNGGDLLTLLTTARAFPTLEDVIADRAERLSLWKSTHFHDAYIRNHTHSAPRPNSQCKALPGIERAKEFPIPNLLPFKANKTLCIFHKEKTPSFHYFPKDNRCYCYGCNRAADAIDIYRQLYNCSFKEAVEKLQ